MALDNDGDKEEKKSDQYTILYRDNVLKMFDMIRKCIEHEDHLINQRTTWFITLNSFLFTGLALFLGGGEKNTFAQNYREEAILLASTVGITISVTTFVSVSAARDSIKKLRELWVSEPKIYNKHDAGGLTLPYITGADSWENLRAGFASSTFVPLVIGSSWLALLFLQFSTVIQLIADVAAVQQTISEQCQL